VDHYNVYDPGAYWVIVTDPYHCSHATEVKPVDFTYLPQASITGDTNYCLHSDFELYGYAGPDITQYDWYRNGTLVASGNLPALQQSGLPAGSYDYQLVIHIAQPGGGSCADTSEVFTLHINNPPPNPTISFNIPDCVLYRVELTAG